MEGSQRAAAQRTLLKGVYLSDNSKDGDSVGGLDWRNRGSASGDPLTRLGVVSVKNNLSAIAVTLSGTAAGDYKLISVTLEWPAVVGVSYGIESSTDLQNWL